MIQMLHICNFIFYTGAFGKVYSGSMESEGSRTVVAIKTIKSERKYYIYTHAIYMHIPQHACIYNLLSKYPV